MKQLEAMAADEDPAVQMVLPMAGRRGKESGYCVVMGQKVPIERPRVRCNGLEKSAVSEHFIKASRAKLKELMERRLDKLKLCALLVDATPFQGQQMIAALGIGQDGRKTILGIRQAPQRTLP